MATPASRQELHSLPGVAKGPPPKTKDFIFQQTMFRIKEPQRSLKFYTEVFGLVLLEKLDFPDAKFSLYFLGQENMDEVPDDQHERLEWCFSRRGTLELTHNWGTESDSNFAGYHSGNSEPKGFGHIGFAVPDLQTACKRFDDMGVSFVKRPEDGSMKTVAFVKDPDGYWIEIFCARDTRTFAQ